MLEIILEPRNPLPQPLPSGEGSIVGGEVHTEDQNLVPSLSPIVRGVLVTI